MIAGTNEEQGLLGNLVSGILGGLIMNTFGSQGITGFDVRSFVVALVGATVVLFIYRALRHHRPASHL